MAESQGVASTKAHNSKLDHVMLVEVDFVRSGLCLFPNNLPNNLREVLAGFHT